MRKPDFCLCESKGADQLRSNISEFIFATRILQFPFFLNPKFQASSFLLRPYRSICVEPGRKPRSPGFSRRGLYSHQLKYSTVCVRSGRHPNCWFYHAQAQLNWNLILTYIVTFDSRSPHFVSNPITYDTMYGKEKLISFMKKRMFEFVFENFHNILTSI